MPLTAEVPLVVGAVALAAVAVILTLPLRATYWRVPVAIAIGAMGAFVQLLAFPVLDPGRASGRALWAWTAVGGPTIQASYRLDGVGAIGVAIGIAYSTAGMLAATRATRRQPLLTPLILAIGLVFLALAVTDDLIATTVVLGMLAGLTSLASLIVAPPQAAARIATYFAIGIQGFVVAALLLSRFGGASYQFGRILPTDVSPGVVLATSIAGALFAGLYPFVPWRYGRTSPRRAEREPLRGLVAMPAGIGASLVVLRLLGTTRLDLTDLTLPRLGPDPRFLFAALVILALVTVALRRRRVPDARELLVGAVLAGGALAYPGLRWSGLILVAALLTVLYAATVSLAIPEEWEVVRYDVSLAALWIAFALGTPTAIAAALFLLAADAATAILEAVWIEPDRAYITGMWSATAVVTGLIGIGIGAFGAGDPTALTLALVTTGSALALVLVHVGRRPSDANVPNELDVTATVVAFMGTLLLGLVCALPLYQGVTGTLGRPFGGLVASAPLAVPAVAAIAALVVVLARSARPLLPDLSPIASTLAAAARLADPVPAGLVAFHLLEGTATRGGGMFALFERRAGIWLATLLIVALLYWSVR